MSQLSNLELPGRFDPSEISSIYDAADVLLLTLSNSPTFDLTVPLRTQSYLAAGKLIVSAVNGESRRIITEAGAGFCGPAEDYNQLSQNLQKAFELSESERLQIGKKGKDYFSKNFDMDRQVERLIEML